MFYLHVGKEGVHDVKILDVVWVVQVQKLQIYELKTLAISGEASDAVHEVFSQIWMFFEGIMHGVESSIFTRKPLIGELLKGLLARKV